MAEHWVMEETKTAEFNDARISARLGEVISSLAKRPTASIPCASGGHAEMTAAYRLFGNPKVTMDRILQPHAESTVKRIAGQETVILAQDTSEIDVTRPSQQVRGAGPLAENTRWGLFIHPMIAFTSDGTPLGTVGLRQWTRDEQRVTSRSKKRSERAADPIEKKESYRWLQSLRRAEEVANECPDTNIICVCDSEADIYEMFSEKTSVNWIIRGCQDRAVKKDGDEKQKHIRESVLAQPVLYQATVNVRARIQKIGCDKRSRRQARIPRKAVCEVRSTRVTLRPPWRPEPNKLPSVEVNVVLVSEVMPPPGEEPVEWLLLTKLPVESKEQSREVVEMYATRWMIEIYFKVLKSGCNVEKRRFESVDSLRACLAVYMIIAWRTLYVCRLARSMPDVNCEAVFEPEEWQPVWRVTQQSSPPDKPPTLKDMTNMVAQLGGYIRRKNSPPGPQTIWIGLQRVYDFAICWTSFGPNVNTEQKDV